ncbi:MAG: hypothetical protein K2N86_02190, partial [Rikenellaceae bacterium]|nr:hypothetical protein [Rikenellaceae bacterium]
MDKKTLLGLILIFAIFLGFSWYNGKQQGKAAAERARIDSLNNIELARKIAAEEAAVKNNERAAVQLPSAETDIEQRTRKLMGDMLY